MKLLDYVVIAVTDLDRAVGFYTHVVGLKLNHQHREYAQLDAGTTRLALYTHTAMQRRLDMETNQDRNPAACFSLGFKVENVDRCFRAMLAAGAEAVKTPQDQAWSQRTAMIKDPDGNIVELIQDLPPAAPYKLRIMPRPNSTEV